MGAKDLRIDAINEVFQSAAINCRLSIGPEFEEHLIGQTGNSVRRAYHISK